MVRLSINSININKMGICPSLSPQERANAYNNKKLKALLLNELQQLDQQKNFVRKLTQTIPSITNRYLLNQGIVEDIQKIIALSEGDQDTSISVNSIEVARESFDDQVRNSCLILQDQIMNKKLVDGQNDPDIKKSLIQGSRKRKNSANIRNNVGDMQKNQQFPNSSHGNYAINTVSFQNNLVQNESLVCQMNIIYERQFLQQAQYQQSLKLFLKWSNFFQQHAYGGFLKPVYRDFCQSLYQIPISDFDTIIDETCVFVQFMVIICSQIYRLRRVYESPSKNGQLFKHQNIYNLIMSFLFKKTNIKKFFKKCIKQREGTQIQKFQKKINQIYNAFSENVGSNRKSGDINSSTEHQFTFSPDKWKKNVEIEYEVQEGIQQEKEDNTQQRNQNTFNKNIKCEKLLQFLEVEPKFRLCKQNLIDKDKQDQMKMRERLENPKPQDFIAGNTSIQSLLDIKKRAPSPRKSIKKNKYPRPYSSCDKLVQNLCQPGQTPITKLKIIVSISKNITKQIYEYYDRLEKKVPDLDPDNLTGIIMYLIIRCGKVELFEELRMVEYFTTSNCLTCISGYYLNTFNAAIETLLQMKIDKKKIRM